MCVCVHMHTCIVCVFVSVCVFMDCVCVCLQIEFFVEHLTPNVVNDQIFPNIASGFMDTNPVVRESTVKVRY